MLLAHDDAAVVVLAGGRASRLPGKLERDAGGVPLLLRVVENVRAAGCVYVSVHAEFSPKLRGRLGCLAIVDAWPRRGPLGGLLTTFEHIQESRVFVVAGDAPSVDATVLSELAAAWEPALEAVIAADAHGVPQPLCAFYDRMAFLREGKAELERTASVQAVAMRLRHRTVRPSNPAALTNINTPADRYDFLERLSKQ